MLIPKQQCLEGYESRGIGLTFRTNQELRMKIVRSWKKIFSVVYIKLIVLPFFPPFFLLIISTHQPPFSFSALLFTSLSTTMQNNHQPIYSLSSQTLTPTNSFYTIGGASPIMYSDHELSSAPTNNATITTTTSAITPQGRSGKKIKVSKRKQVKNACSK